MIDLKKIVDNWNAMCDTNEILSARFEKLEYEEIRKYYSVDDLNNWEMGNKSLKIYGLKELLMKESEIGHATYHFQIRYEMMYKEITDSVDLKHAEFAYHCWHKLQSLLILKMKDKNLLLDFKNNIQGSKNELMADALAYMGDPDEIKYAPYIFDAEIGKIDRELLDREKLNNNLLFKIKSKIKKKEAWMSVLIDLLEYKYFPKVLSDNKNYLISWIENVFEFGEAKTIVPSSIEPLEWNKPVIALAELISKLITKEIIEASIKTDSETRKVILWMQVAFKFRGGDKSLLNYFKSARLSKLKSYCFIVNFDNGNLSFKINY